MNEPQVTREEREEARRIVSEWLIKQEDTLPGSVRSDLEERIARALAAHRLAPDAPQGNNPDDCADDPRLPLTEAGVEAVLWAVPQRRSDGSTWWEPDYPAMARAIVERLR